MKTLKRISALLLALLLAASFSITAFAEESFDPYSGAGIDDDGGNGGGNNNNNNNNNTGGGDAGTTTTTTAPDNDKYLVTNTGEINKNTGYIKENSGTVNENVYTEGTIDTVDGLVASGTVAYNLGTGTVITNNDSVGNNHGTIFTNGAPTTDNPNGGIVVFNCADGVVDVNNGTVSNNFGTITTNAAPTTDNPTGGVITTNQAGGVVDVNNGTIVTNASKDGDTAAGQVNTNNGMITTNNGNVTKNGTEDNSNATIVTNNGVVTNNSGKIGVIEGNIVTGGNFGKVENNISTGEIQMNQTNGEITNNAGLVSVNDDGATVVNNLSGGEIEQNHGTVSVNSGTIDNNFNKVNINTGTITSNLRDVEVNLGGEIQGNMPATNFLSVTVLFDTDSIGASVGSGFCSKDEIAMYCGLPIEKLPDIPENRYLIYDQGSNGTEELAENKAATVFVVAEENIKLETPTVSGTYDADDKGFEITGNSSSWTISFTKFIGNLKINIKKDTSPDPDPPTPPDDDDPVVPPKPDPKPSSPMFVTTYTLKFDLDGGVLDGETELEMKCSAGQRIKLPEAPTKEGFTFAGWETTVRGKTVILDAGAKFTVTAAKTFVALWEEA